MSKAFNGRLARRPNGTNRYCSPGAISTKKKSAFGAVKSTLIWRRIRVSSWNSKVSLRRLIHSFGCRVIVAALGAISGAVDSKISRGHGGGGGVGTEGMSCGNLGLQGRAPAKM